MKAIARIICFVSLTTICVACGGGGSAPTASRITDNTAPVISLVGEDPQIIAVGDPYTELGATAIDNIDGDLTTSIVIDASVVDDTMPGTYLVTYNVRDAAGNAADTVTRTVIYEDQTAPLITLIGDNPQIIVLGNPYTELGATATDNVDGDLAASIVIDASAVDSLVPGDYSVSYNVSDAAGNPATTVIRTVIYEDRTPPLITLVGNNPQIILVGNPYTELGATAIDNVDGDLTAAIFIDASAVDLTAIGNYLVQYNVSDSAGNAATTVTRTVSIQLPVPVEPTVSVEGDIKKLIFSWTDSGLTDFYRLLENADGRSGFTQVGEDIPAGTLSVGRDIAVHLFDWVEAQYIVEACNAAGCSSSDTVTVADVMLDTIGYFKASNTDSGDSFGKVVLSADGATLAVGASGESSSATGINGDQSDNSANRAGAVYVFRLDGSEWIQQAYIKASNTDPVDEFGVAVALSADGATLAIGAHGEASTATGINGNQEINTADGSGAVYVFRFDGSEWAQQAYIKASNTDAHDVFGGVVALSANGTTLAVGATHEDSSATGINGDQADNTAEEAGAVYVFRFHGNAWTQDAYIKASNTETWDIFGESITLSADGNRLAVGAIYEDSPSTGIDGDEGNGIAGAGAVYLFDFDGNDWSQGAYVKASATNNWAMFGEAVALSANGNTLAVGAAMEDSGATGIDGDQFDGSAANSGAVYLFRFDGAAWSQQAYIKASNTGEGDGFGGSVAIGADGDMLAVGAGGEASMAMGINGDQFDDSGIEGDAGAVYLFRFNAATWSQHTYIKASNTNPWDNFGAVALSADGRTLAVGSDWEASSATGINGDQSDNSSLRSGAVYVY